jgi:hypothetical protein
MRKRKIAAAAVGALVLAGSLGGVAAAAGGGKGQAIGQDPLRLALTRCSNAGGGNGGDTETWKAATEKSYLSDCLDKAFKSRYTAEEAAAILAQANCDHWGPWIICEVDPGNSAAHNSAPNDDDL